MKKQKTGFWKTHPLLKVIMVLVVFFGTRLSLLDKCSDNWLCGLYFLLYGEGFIYFRWNIWHLARPQVPFKVSIRLFRFSCINYYYFD